MSDECGYLIGGNSLRPCVMPANHKSNHRPSGYREARRESDKERIKQRREKDGGAADRSYYQANREKKLAYNREWHRVNKEKRKKSRKKYEQFRKENNPESFRIRKNVNNSRRRARRRQVPRVDWTRDQVLALYGSYCYLCRKPLTDDWEADHVIPLSPGWDRIENIRPACASCNNRKRRKMPPLILQMKIWYEIGVHRAGVICE